MALLMAALASGLLFGLGLTISEMINPAKVLAFLDVFGEWDPSLAFVMAGAIAASALGSFVAKRRGVPVFAPKLELPTRRDLDGRLMGGAALFGVGWGLVGFCPGPALAALTVGPWRVLVFVAAMIAGMVLFRFMPDAWLHMTLRREPAGVDG